MYFHVTSAVLSDLLLQNIAFYTFVSLLLYDTFKAYRLGMRTCTCNGHTGTVIIYTNDI